MADEQWRGSFTTPMTPYADEDYIDEQALSAEVAFCVEAGVGGMVVPVMVSEFRQLSEEERRTMIRIPVEVVDGRIPVVANCAAVNAPLAVSYAEYAQEVGADAVIAMPPYIREPDFETVFAYYRAISDAVTIPVWIQNSGVMPLSPKQIVKLCTEVEHVSWVKEEVSPPPHSISAVLAEDCPAIEGVMGGSAGRYMLTEHSRGSRGVIHACEFCDLVQRIWDLLDEGREEEARDLFDHLLPGLLLEGLMGMAFAKEIMVRRGVLKNNRVRMRAHPLDGEDMREIDRVWERIQPHLIWCG